jgi:hypothetical protein
VAVLRQSRGQGKGALVWQCWLGVGRCRCSGRSVPAVACSASLHAESRGGAGSVETMCCRVMLVCLVCRAGAVLARHHVGGWAARQQLPGHKSLAV